MLFGDRGTCVLIIMCQMRQVLLCTLLWLALAFCPFAAQMFSSLSPLSVRCPVSSEPVMSFQPSLMQPICALKSPMKKVLRDMQTLHAGCSKAEPKNFAPTQTLPRGAGWPKFNQLQMVTTFTYKPSLVHEDQCTQF